MKKSNLALFILLTLFVDLSYSQIDREGKMLLEYVPEVPKAIKGRIQQLKKFDDVVSITEELRKIIKLLDKKYNPYFINYEQQDKAIIYCAMISHLTAPYGNSTEVDLISLLGESKLDCDNYVLLTAHLFELLYSNPKSQLIFLGVDGGTVGNHAQLIYVKNDLSLLIDPTYGFTTEKRFDDLLSGISTPKTSFFNFYSYNDQNMLVAVNKTKRAIELGEYTPSNLLYYYNGLEDFLNPSGYVKRFATPGVYFQLSPTKNKHH